MVSTPGADSLKPSRRGQVRRQSRYPQLSPRSVSSSSKGKQRAQDDIALGSGGAGGIILPLEYVGTGAYDAAYTLPVLLGSQHQNISLQIDTGSSDLWVASTSCPDTDCSYPGSDKLYDPRSSTDSRPTSVTFKIPYLSGTVSGEVYWDRIETGGYVIGTQAFAAASSVKDEPLGPSFSGVLGLALPGNSIIASKIAPTFGNGPDGAVWASNLFSITPGTDSSDTDVAPAQKFLSLTFSRPGSENIPSLLGIGIHPPVGMVTLPDSLGGSSAQLGFDKVNYHPPLDSVNSNGLDTSPLFWKVAVTGISVWVGGVEKQIQMTRTPGVVDESASLSAVLDSGVPVILTSSAIANGIYGALGIGPASDGQYYLPCTTPLNLTFNILTYSSSVTTSSTSSSTVSSAKPTPTVVTPLTIPYSVHPLDLSDSSASGSCTSLIQADDTGLAKVGSADMILGIPFLRGVYMVMAYQQPAANGSFPVLANAGDIVPLLGLQTLLDPANSLEEFQRVRVLNEPMDPGPTCSGNSCDDNGGKKKLSVGIDVLIGLGGIIALICIAGALFWLTTTRARSRRRNEDRGVFTGVPTSDLARDKTGHESKSANALAFLIPAWLHKSEKAPSGEYRLAGMHERSESHGTDLSEDDLRRIRYENYLTRSRNGSDGSGNTIMNAPLRPPALHLKDDENTTTMSSGRTRVGQSPPREKDRNPDNDEFGWKKEREVRIDDFTPDGAAETVGEMPEILPQEEELGQVTSPLQYISSPDSTSHPRIADVPSSPLTPTTPSSSHRRFSTSLLPSPTLGSRPGMPPRNVVSDYEPLAEFGELSGMAGIGTAARSKKGLAGGLELPK